MLDPKSDVVRYSMNDVLASIEAFNYFNTINKTNNEKEKEKMNAKKCDRCGKLYEGNTRPIKAYLCGRVTDSEKATYTPEKIKEVNTYTMEVKLSVYGDEIDMCPDCCKKLAKFFESGEDERHVLKSVGEDRSL